MPPPQQQRFDRRTLALGVLFFAIAALLCIADRSPLHEAQTPAGNPIADEFVRWLDGVTEQTLGGPYIYRVLLPSALASLHHACPSVSAITWDAGFKLAFLTLLQWLFFRYLCGFFAAAECVAGVFLLDVLIGYSLAWLAGPHFIETADILTTLAFTAALMALHAGRPALLCAILFAASFNRETMWLVLPAVFVQARLHGRELTWPGLASAAVAVPYFGLRLAIRPSGPWFTVSLVQNVPFLDHRLTTSALVSNVHVLLLLGPLVAIGAYRFRRHAEFLRVASVTVPLFIIVHYAVDGKPTVDAAVFPVLIPLVLGGLASMPSAEREQSHGTS